MLTETKLVLRFCHHRSETLLLQNRYSSIAIARDEHQRSGVRGHLLGRVLTFEKPWLTETDWLVMVEILPRSDEDARERGAKAIGTMLAYSRMTDTRMLALAGDPEADKFKLLFSFTSAENRAAFLRLLQSSEATTRGEEEITVPSLDEISAAEPFARVLPLDVLRRVLMVANLHQHSAPPTVQ